MAKNVYSLQLLRNSQVFTSKEQAIAQLTSGATQDGVIKLARYTQTGTDPYSGDTSGGVKTIFAFRHEVGGQSGWTVYEDYKEVLDVIKSKIDSLAGSGSGSIYDQIIQEINKLDYSGVTTGDGVVVTNVTETDGKVAATAANVGGLKLTGYVEGEASGHVEATDSINAAIAKLQNQIDAANDAKDAAIADLDVEDTAVPGQYVSQVTETDGKISVTRVALPSAGPFAEAGKPITAVSETLGEVSASVGTINAEFVNVTGETFSSTTVQGALEEIESEYKAADAAIVGEATESGNTLGKLEDRIEELATDAKEYHIVKTTTGLPETIKERYSLVDAAGNTSGDTVDIPKDSHIVSITYNGTTQKLTYTYLDASGNTQSTDVDMSQLVLETEFGSGVTVTDHVAHGVVDQQSESFLTVGADGFKLSGVQDAIDAASGDVKSKLDELSGKTNTLSGKTVTGVEMTGGTANIVNNDTDGTKKITINTDGSQIFATGYAKGTDDSAIAATDSINTALAKLENQVDAATTKVVEGTDAGNNLEIVPTTGSDQSVTYTINLTDVASKTALDNEIAARKAVDGQSGQTYVANASANYISGATSLNDADVKLDAAIKALEGAAQTEIDAIEEAIGLTSDGTYSANTTNNYTSAATSVNGAIDALDDAVKANEDDIAELSGKSVTSVTVNGVEVASNNAAHIVLGYTNEAATSENGMVITTDENTGAMNIKFGTLDCGEY